jgi:hypothetical protein
MSYSVTAHTSAAEMFPANALLEEMRKEMRDYQKCVAGKPALILALTDISSICGSALDPESCAPIPREVLKEVLRHAVFRILDGVMEVRGGMGHWSMGGFGSRWIDLDASQWGLDYVRCAFFSKKFHKGEWKCDKPYQLQITCEKANR